MSTLQTFVLGYAQHMGSLVESAGHGQYDVVLPDDVAQHWQVPAYQQWAFAPEAAGQATYLGYNHPLVEEMITAARQQPVATRAYIHDVRLDKSGLVDLARSTWGLPNSRLVEAPQSTVTRVRTTYIRFNFKAALLSDEKQEQLLSVVMDAHAGYEAAQAERILQVAVASEPDVALQTLPLAPMRWSLSTGKQPNDPCALPVLQELLKRAEQAVLRRLDTDLESLQRRTLRFRTLDEARLQAYYDEIDRDLLQRLTIALPERRLSLEEKRASVATERAAKLQDVAERYQVRVELTLLNLMLIEQPKLLVPATLTNRTTTVPVYVVWDPLLHRLEPLGCTVCGEASESVYVCHHGHLAHGSCLAPACIECKRLFCLQCTQVMGSCAVCHKPVCRYSRLTCPDCGRSTCQTHKALCHAEAGQPASLHASSPTALPIPPTAPSTPPAPVTRTKPPAKKPPLPAPPPAPEPPRRLSHIQRGIPKPQRLEVVMDQEESLVVAFVLASRERQIARRCWELTHQGIAVSCTCELEDKCQANRLVLRPMLADAIEQQLLTHLNAFRQEYGLPPNKVRFNHAHDGSTYVPVSRFTLGGRWKDANVLSRATVGFEQLVQRQTPTPRRQRSRS